MTRPVEGVCGVRAAELRARVQECTHGQSPRGLPGRVHVLCDVQSWSVLDGICGVADGRGVGLDVAAHDDPR